MKTRAFILALIIFVNIPIQSESPAGSWLSACAFPLWATASAALGFISLKSFYRSYAIKNEMRKLDTFAEKIDQDINRTHQNIASLELEKQNIRGGIKRPYTLPQMRQAEKQVAELQTQIDTARGNLPHQVFQTKIELEKILDSVNEDEVPSYVRGYKATLKKNLPHLLYEEQLAKGAKNKFTRDPKPLCDSYHLGNGPSLVAAQQVDSFYDYSQRKWFPYQRARYCEAAKAHQAIDSYKQIYRAYAVERNFNLVFTAAAGITAIFWGHMAKDCLASSAK